MFTCFSFLNALLNEVSSLIFLYDVILYSLFASLFDELFRVLINNSLHST